jgi:hypothetical protein
VALILIHSGGGFFSPTGLLNSVFVFIFLLGLNLRFISSRQAFRSFSSRAGLFFKTKSGKNDFEDLIRRKNRLLPKLDPDSEEGRFSLRLGDWMRHPLSAARYFSISREERRRVIELCGAPPLYLNLSQGWGRYLHILLGVAAAIGILFHLAQSCPYFGF